MHERYDDSDVTRIWSTEEKLGAWQVVELAVCRARVNLHELSPAIAEEIARRLEAKPINVKWWKNRDGEVHHDLNAFLDERRRFLPRRLHPYFHAGMTSYDTEEAAFASMLRKSVTRVGSHVELVLAAIEEQALGHRYTIMLGRTHGQEAELQTFGKRCLTWHKDLSVALAQLRAVEPNLKFSKLSGAIGNYTGLDPALEHEALRLLGFEPYVGATQIVPRVLFAPVAQALGNIAHVLNDIALDIRLNARSGRPLVREPFGKKQKGSSAMPHKKNTIVTEQMAGMVILADARVLSLMRIIETWEERAIEQSCIERIEWPELFHVLLNMCKRMEKVILGLQVYQDHMLMEVVDNRGCYATPAAQGFLRDHLVPKGFDADAAYRMVQLASFNVFEPWGERLVIRASIAGSFCQAKQLLRRAGEVTPSCSSSIMVQLAHGTLRVSDELEADQVTVDRWNRALKDLFRDAAVLAEWEGLFDPAYQLRNEHFLFEEILGLEGE